MSQSQRVRVSITCDNAAFEHCWRSEAARQLHLAADLLLLGRNGASIKDYNGNTTGKLEAFTQDAEL